MQIIDAAVLEELNKPLRIKKIKSNPLKKGEILVKIFYSGMCRSQIMEVTGKRGIDPWLPHTLGHEASGIVIDKHKSVKKFKKGDEIILTWIKSSGLEAKNITLNCDKGDINAGPVTTFSNYSVISENRAVIKPKSISFQQAMLFGCAIPTGAGIILNQVKPKQKDSLLIIGLGGIGLAALITAIALKIKKISVIDLNKSKLKYAKSIGAIKAYDASSKNLLKKVFLDNKSGFDFCVESAGLTETIEMGFNLINKDKGQLFFASHPPNNEKISLSPHELISGKKIFGSWGGEVDPDRDIPKLWKLIKKSKIDLNSLIEKEYCLNDINKAMGDLKKGKVFRPLIKMSH